MNHLVNNLESDDLSPQSPYYNEDKHNKVINVIPMKECPACLGNGERFNGQELVTCTICNGSGEVEEDYELTDEVLFDLEEEDEEFY